MNWTGKISRFFVYNGKLTFLLLITLFIWGFLSFFQTPKKYNPTIIAPAFQITVQFPGATRSEILEQVTKPLERVLTDIPGVEDVYSVTMKGGVVIVNVNFFVGEDLDSSKIALNDRLQSDAILAPLGLEPPVVQSVDPEDVPIITLALTDKQKSALELRKDAFRLRDLLAPLKGVSRINVVGGRRGELSILIDQERLGQYAISVDQIEQTLKANNLFLQSGYIKDPNGYIPLETNGLVTNPSEVENIVVVSSDVVKIKLKEFAKVTEGTEEVENYVRHIHKKDGKLNFHEGTTLLTLSKLRGTNISTVTEGIEKRIFELKERKVIDPNLKVDVIVNEGQTAKEEINGLLGNLITSILIVVLVLFFFLNLKAAILVAIAIPLTLASVFGVALLAGQDINRITLFALILSLGLLVDNATVVIENIVRHLGICEDSTDKDVFVNAVNEVGPGLFMSTVTTVIAFIPMAFVTGMMGPYMGPIPFFVPAALILALIISFSINPWMASWMLGKEKTKEFCEMEQQPGLLGRLGNQFMDFYKNNLRGLLENSRKRNSVLIIVALLLVGISSFPVFYLVRFRMLPKADVNQFFLYVDLPKGSSLEQTYEGSRKFEDLLLKDPNVKMVQSFIGTPPITDFNGLFKGVSARRDFHQATIRVGLIDDDNRDIKSEEIVLNMRPRVEALAKEIQNNLKLKGKIKTKLVEDPPGPPVLSTLLVRVQAEDEKIINREAKALLPIVQKTKGVVDTDMSLPEDSETVELKIDHFEASKVKISPAQIISTLRTLYSGKIIGIYRNEANREQEFIRLRYNKSSRVNVESLDGISFRNPYRISVPLKRLVKVVKTKSSMPLYRENHRNTVYIYGEMAKRSVTYAGIDLIKKLYDYKLSENNANRLDFSLFGFIT